MWKPRIKLDEELYRRLTRCAGAAGHASVEEFVRHLLEKETAKWEKTEDDSKIDERLRGLGYIS